MREKVVYEATKEDMVSAIQEVISTEIEEKVYNRFANRFVSSKVVCAVLAITPTTLYNYVTEGRLAPVNPGERNYKFDLSEVLRTDIRKHARTSKLKFKTS